MRGDLGMAHGKENWNPPQPGPVPLLHIGTAPMPPMKPGAAWIPGSSGGELILGKGKPLALSSRGAVRFSCSNTRVDPSLDNALQSVLPPAVARAPGSRQRSAASLASSRTASTAQLSKCVTSSSPASSSGHELHTLPDLRDKFRTECVRLYGSLVRAWRVLLDPGGIGRVSFAGFCKACKSIGMGQVKSLWTALDGNSSGFLTLDEWDPPSYLALAKFRQVCYHNFGGMECAFNRGMTSSRSNQVSEGELQNFCYNYGYDGDVKALFGALDARQNGFIIVEELDFLTTWQTERSQQWKHHSITKKRLQAKKPLPFCSIAQMFASWRQADSTMCKTGPLRWVKKHAGYPERSSVQRLRSKDELVTTEDA